MKIYSAYKEGKLTLYLQGELDHHEVKNSMKLIEQHIDDYMPRDCVIDLAELTFMDSSGIALMLKIYRRLVEMGGRAWIENAENQPLRVIDASGIERIIKVTATKEG